MIPCSSGNLADAYRWYNQIEKAIPPMTVPLPWRLSSLQVNPRDTNVMDDSVFTTRKKATPCNR